jgi:hypothetical protein
MSNANISVNYVPIGVGILDRRPALARGEPSGSLVEPDGLSAGQTTREPARATD